MIPLKPLCIESYLPATFSTMHQPGGLQTPKKETYQAPSFCKNLLNFQKTIAGWRRAPTSPSEKKDSPVHTCRGELEGDCHKLLILSVPMAWLGVHSDAVSGVHWMTSTGAQIWSSRYQRHLCGCAPISYGEKMSALCVNSCSLSGLWGQIPACCLAGRKSICGFLKYEAMAGFVLFGRWRQVEDVINNLSIRRAVIAVNF